MPLVTFVSEQIDFDCPQQKDLLAWFDSVCREEKKTLGETAYIFCSDDYLLDINLKFLQHDYYTDVISFDYSSGDVVSGDIFISLDRVKENAKTSDNQLFDELHRVMVHGLLHLIGYKDKSTADKMAMSAKEDFYLSLRSF